MSESYTLDAHSTLKDATDILWFNDANDNVAMNDVTSSATPSLKSSALAASNAFSVLLQKVRTSVQKTPGACHSSHPSKPSSCLWDVEEAGIVAVTKMTGKNGFEALVHLTSTKLHRKFELMSTQFNKYYQPLVIETPSVPPIQGTHFMFFILLNLIIFGKNLRQVMANMDMHICTL